MRLSRRNMPVYVTAAVLLAVSALAFIQFFERIDIEETSLALDWLNLYPSIEGGWLRYDDTGLRQAPWSVLPLLPLGLLSVRAGWGMLTFIMFIVLVAAVPRHRNRLLYVGLILLTVLSFPALRTVADGNFEIISTAGALLVVFAYRGQQPVLLAVAALLASSKPQVSVLLLLVVGLYAVAQWPTQKWVTAAGITLAIVVVSLLIWGRGWYDSLQRMQEFGSIMDSSMGASAARTGMIPPLAVNLLRAVLIGLSLAHAYLTRWTLSREKAGMLIAASLLIAPYAAGNSALSVFAVGVLPLLFSKRWAGVVLIVLTNALYLMLGQNEWMFRYSAYYWTGYFFVAWVLLGWASWQIDRQKNT
ncbi:MAG: glycosyltransferase 87 family protein [Chloroflexota bacterium]